MESELIKTKSHKVLALGSHSLAWNALSTEPRPAALLVPAQGVRARVETMRIIITGTWLGCWEKHGRV